MVKGKVVVSNSSGLHLRPASILCRDAMRFKSKISFKTGNTIANAKSVLSVLGACVQCGDEIELICQGTDENEALKFLIEEISNGLVEE